MQRNLCPSSNIPSIDLNAACSGFLYGLDFGSGLLASGRYERILLIGAEALTRWLDYEDRTTCVIFGDGAGAVILENSQSDRGLLDLTLGADGEFVDNIEYAFAGTPCAGVLEDEEVCAYERDVQMLFPDHGPLADMDVDGYVGAPLFDSSGQLIGLIMNLSGL